MTRGIWSNYPMKKKTKGLDKVAELGPGIQFGELAL